MAGILKKIFDFSNSQTKDSIISKGIQNVQKLIKSVQKQKYTDLSNKVKQILNILLKNPNETSLYELSYESAMTESPIQWIHNHTKLINLLNPKQSFMRTIFEFQDLKISLEKQYIPSFLFKNNILNQRSGYLQIYNSVQGLVVPLLDYVFIRIIHAISQLNFIAQTRQLKEQYQSDDIYFYMSRNPYLILLHQNFLSFKSSQRIIRKISNYIKLFFIDELIMKYRLNKTSSISINTYSFISTYLKYQPHHFLTIFILLHHKRELFEEKDLWLNEVISKYSNIIERDTQILFRFFIRLFIYSFAESVQGYLIQSLSRANQNDGVFAIQRYSVKQFKTSLRGIQKRQKHQFDKHKTAFLQLLEKDQYFMIGKRVHFSIIRSLQIYLTFQLFTKKMMTTKRQVHQQNSQASSLQKAITKINKYKNYMQLQKVKKSQNQQQFYINELSNQLTQLSNLYEQVINKKYNWKQQVAEDYANKNYNIRGLNSDYVRSVETYRNQIQYNCWKVPLKDSEFQVLYNIFYQIAKYADKFIPGHKRRKQPVLNLRFLCNPIIFTIALVLLILIFKIIF